MPPPPAQILQMEGLLGLEALGLWGTEVSGEAGGLGGWFIMAPSPLSHPHPPSG